MNDVYKIISDTTMTYKQQLLSLARLAEGSEINLDLSDEYYNAKNDSVICDLNEGNAPYRPRYIIPDYSVLMNKGCDFLQLDAPTDLWEACNSLLIMYSHVPSITSFPVYLGGFDDLLEPFVTDLSDAEIEKCLRLFLLNIDRTLTDSFVHANIGPKDSRVGRIVLKLSEQMQLAIPNITLKYDEELTSDEFANLAITCMLKTAKPSFANHKMFVSEWSENYSIASCYNGLKIGGGGYTLPRLRMYELSQKAIDINDFMNNVLPKYTKIMCEFMDARVKFIVEESAFFKSNFLVTEKFLDINNFTGMFGMVGLNECVNNLLNIKDHSLGYGNNEKADEIGVEIMEKLSQLVADHKAPYCSGFNDQYRLHAQVGIDSDGREDSPGARIRVGNEPEIFEHIVHSGKFHKYFPTGIGDIFKFEETWLNTPNALLDIIKGAFKMNMRYFSGYLDSNDVVRVTGYLVKKSELYKLDSNKQSLNNVSIFGKGARDTGCALDRKVEKNVSTN